jgi:hypothetical protein
MRPTALNQDELLALFDGSETGAGDTSWCPPPTGHARQGREAEKPPSK